MAYREALALRRRQSVERSALEKVAAEEATGRRILESPDARILQWESVERVRRALSKLPNEQRQVVQLKICEQKKIRRNCGRVDLPLGTVITRMHLALAKLRRALGGEP